MYTKTFEADTLDEALKAVKFELGPDAIILKTITNKGLKGAFKKKRIEITAAIPERSYEKKARVDHVLNAEQKEQFYNSSADHISKSIDKFNAKGNQQEEVLNFGYGSMGLNKVVKKTTSTLKNSLDDFLGDDSGDEAYVESDDFADDFVQARQQPARPAARPVEAQRTQAQIPAQQAQVVVPERKNVLPTNEERELKREVQLQYLKIEKLEEKINELAGLFNDRKKEAQAGLTQLRTTLKTLDLSERLVGHIIKRASFELTPQELQNADMVFDFALREIEAAITCSAPMFATQEKTNTAVVTILISEVACGQSSMAFKMACMKKDCTLIQLGNNDAISSNDSLATKMFKIQVAKVNSLTELITECRKCVEIGRSVFVDFRNQSAHTDETMKFIEGMKRAFSNIEVLITISAIHTELYNKKTLAKFRDIAQGVVVSHLDLCLNYGSLLNVHVGPTFERVEQKAYGNNAINREKLPLKFFGTGNIIPDDIEPASPERIIAGMFEL